MEHHITEIDEIPPNDQIYDYASLHSIDVVDYKQLTYNKFFQAYMVKNHPCIIKNVSCEWPCSKDWINDNQINLDGMLQEYGEIDVPVAICDDIKYNAQSKISMTFSEYVDYFKKPSNKLLYLKDWHLQRAQPNTAFYTVPLMFTSDWLNEYAIDNGEDDFKFVYMGPANTWTPLHVDVYHSYSWSVNVIGKKKWLLFPPKEELKLKDALGNLPLLYDVKTQDDVKFFEVIQETSDAIFVPSGWHHQVINIKDTISINHNWINACNITMSWNALMESLNAVEREISDLKDSEDFNKQCQIILKSVFGMDCENFAQLIKHIGVKRLHEYQAKQNRSSTCNNVFGIKHVRFDLSKILEAINKMLQHHLFFFKYCDNKLLYSDLNNLKISLEKI